MCILNSTTFAKHFSTATKVAFNPAWAEFGGYFGKIILGDDAPLLRDGEVICSIAPDARKLLIIGTKLGNAVVFQRYSDREEIFARNFSNALKEFCGENVENLVDAKAMDFVFGDETQGSVSAKISALSQEAKIHLGTRFAKQVCAYKVHQLL